MKRILLSAALMLQAFNLFGQGVIIFANNESLPVRNPITGSLAVGMDGIVVALYWAPLETPHEFSQLGDYVLVGEPPSDPGLFYGGPRTTGPATAPGEEAFFRIRGWEAAYGSTYEAAQAAPPMNGRGSILCKSPTFFLPTQSPAARSSLGMASPPDSPFTGITCVPEPSAIVLGLLGFSSLLFLRRRS